MMRWPEADARAVPLLAEIGATHVWLPWEAARDREPFLAACHKAGIRVIAEMPLSQADRLGEVRASGFDGVAIEISGEEDRAGGFAWKHSGMEMFALLDPSRAHWRVEPARAVLRAGLWPGSQRPQPGQASATERTWVNANLHLIAWLRARFPQRQAILGYRADESAGLAKDQRAPFWTVELSMAEAAVAGGTVIVSLPDNFREALLGGQGMAREAWESMLGTRRFLTEFSAQFQRPVASRVAVLAGELEECGEILNLMFRHNVSPAVISADAPVALERFRVLVGVGLGRRPVAAKAALQHARAGGQLMVAPANENEPEWWKVAGLRKLRSEEERDVYALGRGAILVYRAPVADPSEFALDVIDVLGWRRRDLRIWGADAIIGVLHRQDGGAVSVDLVNYGGREGDFLIRLEGAFHKATLRQPGLEPLALRAAIRGSGTEIEMPRIQRVASLLVE
jgi:hypothetical protein